jgi:hypothetical protein
MDWNPIDPDGGGGELLGPDPFVDGESRLSFGIFYEGRFSDLAPIDDVTSHFYVYENTFAVEPTSERVEGSAADRLVRLSDAWWGGGLHFDNGLDLSPWDTLHVSLRSADMDALEIIVNDGADAAVSVTDYGYVADDTWHHLAIPLADFIAAGLDPAAVSAAFVILGQQGSTGDAVLIDNLYLTAE